MNASRVPRNKSALFVRTVFDQKKNYASCNHGNSQNVNLKANMINEQLVFIQSVHPVL